MTGPEHNPHDTLPPSMDPETSHEVRDPPKSFWGIVKCLGPGLIIAGSIVGSGELIATTKTGAEAGISLLWLILLGCVIKVFCQIELGRYAVCHGETTLAALDTVPGPRLRVNWLIWFWILMFLASQAQLGGIVGGVGQALAIACPITGDYRETIVTPSEKELVRYLKWENVGDADSGDASATAERKRILAGREFIRQKIERLDAQGGRGTSILETVRSGGHLATPTTWDDRYWSVGVTLVTIGMLFRGRYSLVQNVSTVLVVGFTFITIGNVISLQEIPAWRVSPDEFWYGMSFHLPVPTEEIPRPLITALATFGIIGVGASELVSYPYWCLEKGYAKFAGPRSDDENWARRARAWMRVMHYDAFASMVVYTIATLAFFLMGAAVLHRQALNPDGMRMVGTLMEQYVPVFGEYAKCLFLLGAFAVLYSTFLVANAGNARMSTDVLKVFRLMDRHNQRSHDRGIAFFCVLLPLMNLALYWTGYNPVKLVLIGGTMQAVMLPMLGFAALYFRYRHTDERLKPGRLWDSLLILSCVGLLIAGGYIGWTEGTRLISALFGG
jgi:Mn2+/Fe2+ NRAMP family transporter